jgi:hypothetical protein
MDKRKIKEFTATLSEMLFNKADEEGWGHNDIWNVTEWFVLNSVVIIAIDGIIPQEELRIRLERNFHELLDEAFKEVEELKFKNKFE